MFDMISLPAQASTDQVAWEVTEFGPHTMQVNFATRTVEVLSDLSASDRAARRNWKPVVKALAAIGATLDSSPALVKGTEIFSGSF